MKRIIAAVCILGVTLSLAGFQGASAAPGLTETPSFTPTLSPWAPCAPGGEVECSRLTVPLDYTHPSDGRTVSLALTRLAACVHAGPAGCDDSGPVLPYNGLMLLNIGGPGAPGTPYVGLRDAIPNDAGKTYDWVGFDPRGVGDSTPALHCNANYFGANRPNFVPRTDKIRTYWLNRTKGYAAACANSSAKRLLPFMSTRDTVKDMESLRAAYRASAPGPKKSKLNKVNFYGFSYGTYLAVVYATLYPARVGRFVLDGVVDPKAYWYQGNLNQDIGFDRNLNIFFRWVAARPGTYHLGRSWANIRAGYNAMLRTLDKHPAANGRLGPDELADAMLSAAYYIYDWESIATAYSDLVRKRQGGALYDEYASGNLGAEAENGYAVYNAVQCTDQRRPPLAQQLRDSWQVHKKAPFLTWDNTWYNMPCRTWAAPARGKVAVDGSALTKLGTKILLINETKDAATPYAGALNVRGIFKTARLIAGVGGTTHAGSLSGVTCVDNRIASYLLTGKTPARNWGTRGADVNCPKVPPPGSRTSGRVTGTGMPWDLRDELMRAQR